MNYEQRLSEIEAYYRDFDGTVEENEFQWMMMQLRLKEREEYVGLTFAGFCDGFFGRDSYGRRMILAHGDDWLVALNIEGEKKGEKEYTEFYDAKIMREKIEEWIKQQW